MSGKFPFYSFYGLFSIKSHFIPAWNPRLLLGELEWLRNFSHSPNSGSLNPKLLCFQLESEPAALPEIVDLKISAIPPKRPLGSADSAAREGGKGISKEPGTQTEEIWLCLTRKRNQEIFPDVWQSSWGKLLQHWRQWSASHGLQVSGSFSLKSVGFAVEVGDSTPWGFLRTPQWCHCDTPLLPCVLLLMEMPKIIW